MSTFSTSKEPARKKKGAYKMPPEIPFGLILTDSGRKEWVIQTAIARGGFGEIYTASSKMDRGGENFVIKIEPSENGPLFCEKTVYIRIGKKEDIQEYKKMKGLKTLGMPTFLGSGTHSLNGKKFRFLVMERYGKDLWTIFLKENRIFPPATVFKVAIQVLDVLEYIHSKGYVHADIKGPNLLLGRTKGCENQVYLVDFGLAARYTDKYKPDPRRAHNGTLEYTSRDGHEGIVTRRGDIEILGYNLLQWLSSNLPWEGIRDLLEVQSKKNKWMTSIKGLMEACFQDASIPKAIKKYFDYLVSMQPLEEPDYHLLRQIMKEGISATGDVGNKLEFSIRKTSGKNKSVIPKSPIPVKRVKTNPKGRGKNSESSKTKSDSTIDIFESSSSSSSSEEDLIETTPDEKTKTNVKRSWKDCPSVVSCAELLLKDRNLRRSKRNK